MEIKTPTNPKTPVKTESNPTRTNIASLCTTVEGLFFLEPPPGTLLIGASAGADWFFSTITSSFIPE